MSLKAGITGGIGSGKSLVCDIFRTLGVPVFNSDLEAKKILETDHEIISGVKGIFGEEIYSSETKPNRKEIASVVFSDHTKLEQLNALVHPAVEKAFKAWMEIYKDADYVLKEAAILIESGAYLGMDAIILVTAPEALRFERAALRDGISVDMVRKRAANQMPASELTRYADFTIVNDGNELIIPQVFRVHEQLKTKAAAAKLP